jgi:hypothetical protein
MAEPDPNPYASPRVAADGAPPRPPAIVGVWRQGDYLKMHRRAELPAICVFTGEQDEVATMRVDYFGPGEKYSLQLVIERDAATISIPIKRSILASYDWMTMLLVTSITAGAILAIAFALVLRASPLAGTICGIGSAAAFLVAAYATLSRPALVLYDMNANYLWFRGASPEFLRHLPDWAGNE